MSIVNKALAVSLVVVSVALAATIGTRLGDTSFGFELVNAQVIRDKGTLKLELHRRVKHTIIGGFYVSLRKEGVSCTATYPHDVIEVRPDPFKTRFMSRFDKRCLGKLTPGEYQVTVTYDVYGNIFSKDFTATLTEKDIQDGKL